MPVAKRATLTCPVPSDPGHGTQGTGSNRSLAANPPRKIWFSPSMLALQRTPRARWLARI